MANLFDTIQAQSLESKKAHAVKTLAKASKLLEDNHAAEALLHILNAQYEVHQLALMMVSAPTKSEKVLPSMVWAECGMTHSRWRHLAHHGETLTQDETNAGWHYCNSEWDGMLIHTTWPEKEACTCVISVAGGAHHTRD
jgi:hypothetical protein